MVVKKLGQPVPLSYFISEVKSGKLQPTQAKTPGRFSLFSGLEPGRSVPSSRRTLNCMGSSRLRHSSFDSLSGSEGSGTLIPSARSAFQLLCNASISLLDENCAAKPRGLNAAQTLATPNVCNILRRVIAISFAFPLWPRLGFDYMYGPPNGLWIGFMDSMFDVARDS